MLKPATFPSCARVLTICLLLASGCDDNVKVRTITARPQGDAQAPVLVSCAEQDDGVGCGDGRHCLSEQCVFNTCGDGIAADQEQCDDGNALSNDGCTPSCRMELESCPDGGLKVVGQECPSADAGARPLCPMITSFSVNGDPKAILAKVLVGESISLEATALGGSAKQRWIYSGKGAFSSSGLKASIFCSEPVQTTDLYFLLTRPDCPNSVARIPVECTELPDAGLDAAAPDGGTSDAGLLDGGTSDAGPLDGGPRDAGPQDASTSDGSTDGGGSANPFGSTACETCMRENCTSYEGLQLFDPCFKNGVSASFTKLCTDAFVCSRKSPDKCADNATVGAVVCFCGVGVTVDDCAKTPSGNCKSDWYAAGECATSADQNSCVLDNFSKEATAAGVANYTLECRRISCQTQCP